jgi:multidrug resistance protein
MTDGRHPLKRLWVLMATVFVDMMGFFIVLPLLPFYAEKLGASPLGVGSLVSTFALAQLVTAPAWGRLSDRFGRRPMILAGLLVSAGAYVIFEMANVVWLLFLSRFVQGMGSGTTGVVQAYVSDTIPKEDRAKAIGWLTAGTSAGVMLGPVVGSVAASLGWLGPGYVAAGLCLLNFAFGLRWLEEPASQESVARRKRTQRKGDTRRAVLNVLRYPRDPVSSMIWVYTLGMMAFMAMNGIFALYLERVFGIDEKTIGWFFFYVGAISLVMRSVAIGPVVGKLGERRTMRLGAVLIALGMTTIPFARNIPELALAVLLIPVGTALLFPTTTSIVSRRAQEDQVGMILGVQQAFGGVARLLGPIWAGAVFQFVGIRWPFWIAAFVMALGRLFVGQMSSEDSGETKA